VIYLASASPRRQELLRQIGVAFEVVPTDIPEVVAPGERAADYVLRVARAKAEAAAARIESGELAPATVLGADTEVVLDGEVLGKPLDRDHGCAMLQRLAGRSHEVLSGVCLGRAGAWHTALSRSTVTFAPLTAREIEAYWMSGEPAGKAGGYAIQGRAAVFISRLEGSYSGVMGLPLHELAVLLRQTGEWPS
jgi:septum formation protein